MASRRAYLHTKLPKLFARRAADPEDMRRRAFILEVLLISVITLLAIAVASSVLTSLTASSESRANNALSFLVLGALLVGFCTLYAASRKGYVRIASPVFVSVIAGLSLYLALRWGADLPAAMLFYALSIVTAGILVGSRFSLLVTGAICGAILAIQYAHEEGYILANGYWRTEQLTLYDAVVIAVMLGVVAVVSWLSTREIEKSLARARLSEALLKEERDQLEVRVRERTEELRQAELERMSQAYRFVEFGRLASGIFHDLMNPLTALSLNIEGIERAAGKSPQLTAMSEDIARARSATAHMQGLMESMRRHLAREGREERFSLSKTLEEAVLVLRTYGRQRNVSIHASLSCDREVTGDPVAFLQVLTNLLTNAIESHAGEGGEVHISLTDDGDRVLLSVRDTGSGILPEHVEQVFEPFFSTKADHEGLGIGLPLAKRIIEKEFDGTISVASVPGSGTTFTVYLPIREP